jgi:uroporphyrinogen-III synthase
MRPLDRADPDGARQPLEGLPVVVCRARADAELLADQLRALGARPIQVPLLATGAPADGGAALTGALAQLDGYGWLVATSANGVQAVAEALEGRAVPPGVGVAAVGPATASAFEAAGIAVDLVPAAATAADLALAFPPADGPVRVLAALAELASADLVTGLRSKGYTVDRVDAYRIVEPPVDPEAAAELAGAEAVLFTSPSIVDRFVDRFSLSAVPATAVCIGPRTAARARQRGVAATVVAPVHTNQGLVDALVAARRSTPPSGS